ncbi:hypothetical protein Lal_00005896 [Lupinus albus]|nr:hypothetical protein Lal_00005896 [Lupinus albus]
MKDPKVGGGSEGTCKVTQNQPRHAPRISPSQLSLPRPGEPTLAQARHPRSSESTLAQARILQYSPRFHPPRKGHEVPEENRINDVVWNTLSDGLNIISAYIFSIACEIVSWKSNKLTILSQSIVVTKMIALPTTIEETS